MEKIIGAISRDIIEAELNEDRFIRITNKGNNKIYIVNQHNAPNTMQEIGRLREISFRDAGGGTGMSVDIDEYDTKDRCYEQLIVYNPEDREIVGGYRFILGKNAYLEDQDHYDLSTAHYFQFHEKMKRDILPYSIELGRSWVQTPYQPTVNPRKGVFSLSNIWDGLGALVIEYPEIKYFFGKVTMYTSFNHEARDLLLSFMAAYFPDKMGLCEPIGTMHAPFDNTLFKQEFQELPPFKEGFKQLKKLVKDRGEWVPPLFNIYMNLSSTMMTFGTAVNDDFGGVEETALLVKIGDIYQEVKDRHISDYKKK